MSTLNQLLESGQAELVEETFDDGNRLAFGLALSDGAGLILRHAVMCDRHETVRAPTYETRRVPLAEALLALDDTIEDSELELGQLTREEGQWYAEQQVVIQPGEYRERDPAELRAEARGMLSAWLDDKIREAQRLVSLVARGTADVEAAPV